jgi:RNA polymerase sigma factor (sigma-70 family)
LDEKTLIERLKADDSEARRIFWNQFNGPVFQFLLRVSRRRGFQNRDGSWAYDSSDAEDILMKTFRKAIRDIHQHRGERPLEHWLIVIASRTTSSFYRDERRHHPRRPELIAAEVAGTYSADGSGGGRIPDNDGIPFSEEDEALEADEMLDLKSEDGSSDRRKIRIAELSAYAFERASHWGADGNVDNDIFQTMTSLVEQLPTDYRLVIVLRVYERKSSKETAEIMSISEEAVRALKYRATRQLAALWKKTHSNGKGGRFNEQF